MEINKIKKEGRNRKILMWYNIVFSIMTLSFMLLIVSFIVGSYMEYINLDAIIMEWSIVVNFIICIISIVTVIFFNIWVDKKILS